MGLFSKNKSKAPASPDPIATSTQSLNFDRLNTYGPTGAGQRYGYTDPATGQFVQGTPPKGTQAAVQAVESPYEQIMRTMLEGGSKDVVSAILGDDVPDRAEVQNTDDIAKALYDRNYSLMAPSIAKGQSRLLTNLQARGLPVGGEAFTEAYSAQQRQTEDTLSRLAQDATLTAGQEQSRRFSIDSQARSDAMSELLQAITGGFTVGTEAPSGVASGSNYAQLVQNKYTADMAKYQQDKSSKNSALGTLGSIAGSAIAKCSRLFKLIDGDLDQAAASRAVETMPLSVWRYREEHAPEGMAEGQHVGPMAEDFHAITGLGDGKSINLLDLVGLAMGALQHALQRIDAQDRLIAQMIAPAAVTRGVALSRRLN